MSKAVHPTFQPVLHFADDAKTRRAYSAAAAAADYFEIAVGMAGTFSERLGALEPEGEGGIVVRGPFGKWIE